MLPSALFRTADSDVLSTRRLVLRPLVRGDIPAIAALGGDWDVASMTSRMPWPYTVEIAAHWLDEQADGEFVRAIDQSGRFIGICGYLPDGTGTAEIGYWLGKPFWGRGYATEAGQALVDHAFWTGAFEALTCAHFVDNPASQRVIEKLGFRRIGQRSCWCEAQQREIAAIGYHLTRRQHQWLRLRRVARNGLRPLERFVSG